MRDKAPGTMMQASTREARRRRFTLCERHTLFVGHFAGGFGLKHAAPAISLGKLAVITWALLIGGAYRDLASTRRAW